MRQGDRKPGVACHLFPFFNKLHYRYKLDTYKCKLRLVREPYLATLCPSGSFSVPARTARISHAFSPLKSDLRCLSKSGHGRLAVHFFIKSIVSIRQIDTFIISMMSEGRSL